MSRVVQYSSLIQLAEGNPIKQHNIRKAKATAYVNRPIIRQNQLITPSEFSLIKNPHAHSQGIYFATHLDVAEDPFHQVQQITIKGLYGDDYDKLDIFANEAEMKKGVVENANVDIFYWHLLSQFWSIEGGLNYFYRPALKPYWQLGFGIEGLMPYFIDIGLRSYLYAGAFKLDAEIARDSQITNNFFVRLSLRSIFATQTQRRAMIGSGLNQIRMHIRPFFRVMPGMDLFVEYETKQDYGAFKRLSHLAGGATHEETFSVGFSLLF